MKCKLFSLAMVAILLFTACEKEEENPSGNEQLFAKSLKILEDEVNTNSSSGIESKSSRPLPQLTQNYVALIHSFASQTSYVFDSTKTHTPAYSTFGLNSALPEIKVPYLMKDDAIYHFNVSNYNSQRIANDVLGFDRSVQISDINVSNDVKNLMQSYKSVSKNKNDWNSQYDATMSYKAFVENSSNFTQSEKAYLNHIMDFHLAIEYETYFAGAFWQSDCHKATVATLIGVGIAFALFPPAAIGVYASGMAAIAVSGDC